MVWNKKITDWMNRNERDEPRLKCYHCGNDKHFQVRGKLLICEHCGTLIPEPSSGQDVIK